MRRLVRAGRWILGAIALALAARWTWSALQGGRLCVDCPDYGRDPETGLVLRVGPLTPVERAAALEREAEAGAEGIMA